MKTKIAAYLSLLITSTSFAHVSTVPHAHEGSHTNWTPGLLSVAAVAFVGFIGWKLFSSRSTKQK